MNLQIVNDIKRKLQVITIDNSSLKTIPIPIIYRLLMIDGQQIMGMVNYRYGYTIIKIEAPFMTIPIIFGGFDSLSINTY